VLNPISENKDQVFESGMLEQKSSAEHHKDDHVSNFYVRSFKHEKIRRLWLFRVQTGILMTSKKR
jgi:hypothetical protein